AEFANDSFFFSSRRRHTSCLSDWSSDVCSSDLHLTEVWDRLGSFPSDTATLFFALATIILIENRLLGVLCLVWAMMTAGVARVEIGRASCRERVENSGVECGATEEGEKSST